MTIHYDDVESRAIAETSDELSHSSAVDVKIYYFPSIVDLKLDNDMLAEIDNIYVPHIVTLIGINSDNRKLRMRQNFDCYIIGPKYAVRHAREYEECEQKSIMKNANTVSKSTRKSNKNGESCTLSNIKNKPLQRLTVKQKSNTVSSAKIQRPSKQFRAKVNFPSLQLIGKTIQPYIENNQSKTGQPNPPKSKTIETFYIDSPISNYD